MEIIDEKKVLEFYISMIDNDKVDFLQGREKYKKSIRKYIISLNNSESMHEKIEIAKNLWKILFEASMSYIDSDMRGYDSLFAYFDEYVNFEELIFASDSFYRDHTIHCLWVYFLGEYIKNSEEFKGLFVNYNSELKKHMDMVKIMEKSPQSDVFKDYIEIVNSLTDIDKSQASARCVSALTHDLGYPLKKVNKINKCIGKVLPYFSVNNYSEFNFTYNTTQQSFIESFIMLMSMTVGYTTKEADQEGQELAMRVFGLNEYGEISSINEEKLNSLDENERAILKKMFDMMPMIKENTNKKLRYFNDFEQLQHGIMSAFLLIKTLKAFRNINLRYSDYLHIDTTKIDFRGILAKSGILQSISDHTCDDYQITGIRGNSDLLILIDELEEFSRISRANMNRQFIEEFCKSSIYMKEGVLNIEFIFDNDQIDNLDPEKAFKGRCKKFLTLFDIKQLDEELKIKLSCIGRLKRNQNTYTLEIGRKYANIIINGVEQNIPAYLKSRQFYSREEYMKL
jgi:hypothetical protein